MNPHAIEGFAVMQAIAVVALVVLSFGGSAAFLSLLDSFFGSTNAQRGQPVLVQSRHTVCEAPVPRVVLLRIGLMQHFESFLAELSECDPATQNSGKAESVIARHWSSIRERALQILADSGKSAQRAKEPRRED